MLADHETISATDLRDESSEVLSRVRYGHERIVISKNRKRLAAIISIEDLALLERLEDMSDVLLAKRAERDAKAKGEKPVPYSEARKRLGL